MAQDKPPTTSRSGRRRILLVDDHPMVRERMREIIEQETDLMVCGEAEERHEALERIATARPDLVTVDLSLKDSHGLDLIENIHVQHPALFMLVVSMHEESLYAERVLRAGAHGYITKHEATRNILKAIRQVLAGELYLAGGIANRILARLAHRHHGQDGLTVDALSDRELRVFELSGRGYNTRYIANALGVNVKTVETYRSRIRQKLSLKSSSELLQAAINWVHHS